MQNLIDRILEFRDLREWQQFHTARTLATSILIESSELMEVFQWVSDDELNEVVKERRDQISEEVSDILIYILLFAEEIGINLEEAVERKLDLNEKKYPIEKAKGNANKHNDL